MRRAPHIPLIRSGDCLEVAANDFASGPSAKRAKGRVIDFIREKSNRAVDEGKLDATGMIAAKTSHERPADRGIRISGTIVAVAGLFPIEVQFDACDRPIAVAHEGSAVLVFRRSFPDKQRLTCPVGDLAKLNAPIEIRVAPKHSKAFDGVVTT